MIKVEFARLVSRLGISLLMMAVFFAVADGPGYAKGGGHHGGGHHGGAHAHAGGHHGGGHGSFAAHHPRRAEVLHRDRHEQHRLNRDKGHLGGNYNHLSHEDRSIHRQERRDKNRNGGYITKGQQHHLNREENRLNRQIHRDHN